MASMDVTTALSRYLSADMRTGDNERDLVNAAQLAGDWRRNGPAATGAILYALHMNHNYTLRALENLTGIPMKSCDRLIEKHHEALGGK